MKCVWIKTDNSCQNRLRCETLCSLVIRTMATWGSTPCNLDDDDSYRSELGAEEEEEQEECSESSSDDVQIYSSGRNQLSYSNRKNQGW